MKKRITAVMMAAVVILASMSACVFAEEGKTTDFSGHWAEELIEDWFGYGILVLDENGGFRPDECMSRMDFVSLVNEVFASEEEWDVSYSDVPEDSPCASDIAKAAWMGYISGYGDGTFRPEDTITRAEAAKIIDDVFDREALDEAVFSEYKDKDDIPAWCEDAMAFSVFKGYLGGYPSGTIVPYGRLTRAEAVAILDRAAGTVYSEPGVYGPESGAEEIEGNVTVVSEGVTLRNMDIMGDLHITAGVGDGDVSFSGVTVSGEKYIRGGGTATLEYFSDGEFVHELSESDIAIPGFRAYEITGVTVGVEDGRIVIANGIFGDDGSISEDALEDILYQEENRASIYTENDGCVSFDVFAPSNGRLIRVVSYEDGKAASYDMDLLDYCGDENSKGYVGNMFIVCEKDENGKILPPGCTNFDCDLEFAWFYEGGKVERTHFTIEYAVE